VRWRFCGFFGPGVTSFFFSPPPSFPPLFSFFFLSRRVYDPRPPIFVRSYLPLFFFFSFFPPGKEKNGRGTFFFFFFPLFFFCFRVRDRDGGGKGKEKGGMFSFPFFSGRKKKKKKKKKTFFFPPLFLFFFHSFRRGGAVSFFSLSLLPFRSGLASGGEACRSGGFFFSFPLPPSSPPGRAVHHKITQIRGGGLGLFFFPFPPHLSTKQPVAWVPGWRTNKVGGPSFFFSFLSIHLQSRREINI